MTDRVFRAKKNNSDLKNAKYTYCGSGFLKRDTVKPICLPLVNRHSY